MKTAVLVVDDDEWITRVVARTLTAAGHDVVTAPDGEEALIAARARTPGLVVSDVVMPRMDGWTFVKRLRALPECALVPVIFLTSRKGSEDVMRGFRLGADDYVAKPFDLEDLCTRVATALERRRAIEERVRAQLGLPGRSDVPALAASLDQVGLPSLLTLLEMEGRTGIVRMKRAGETAEVHVRGGRPVRARVEGVEPASGLDALFRLLGWTDGSFRFAHVPVEGEDEIATPTATLLLEAARRLDEAAHRNPDDPFSA